jgi:hypothetical protein
LNPDETAFAFLDFARKRFPEATLAWLLEDDGSGDWVAVAFWLDRRALLHRASIASGDTL